jgi:hypothetical protein
MTKSNVNGLTALLKPMTKNLTSFFSHYASTFETALIL